jgi:hypothetical protein
MSLSTTGKKQPGGPDQTTSRLGRRREASSVRGWIPLTTLSRRAPALLGVVPVSGPQPLDPGSPGVDAPPLRSPTLPSRDNTGLV